MTDPGFLPTRPNPQSTTGRSTGRPLVTRALYPLPASSAAGGRDSRSGRRYNTIMESNTYDEVPYESHPYAQTHPSRLAVFGLVVPPVRIHDEVAASQRRRRSSMPSVRRCTGTG